MDFIQQIKEAFANLTGAKLRSFLAILGILVGTGAVVALVNIGQLATEHALAQFKRLGTDLLSINIYQQDSGGSQSADTSQEFNNKDVTLIAKYVPSIRDIAPYVMAFQPLAYRGEKIQGSIIGSTAPLQDIIKIDIKKGRFISPLDGSTLFCVIGNKVAKQLRDKGNFSPIGSQIQVGKEFCTIIGIAGTWQENSFFNQDINSSVIVTIPVAKLFAQYAKINNIVLRLKPNANFKTVENKIKSVIQKISPGENIFFRSPQEIIKSMSAQRKTMTTLLGLIGGISLFVGGIGVMNIMLVSVVERRKEIGIRMAIGARRRDIQILFLVESITLALFGGLLGVLFGVTASFLVASFAHWEFTFFVLPPVVGFFVSFFVGIFFGFYPAYQASQLDPIEALRSD